MLVIQVLGCDGVKPVPDTLPLEYRFDQMYVVNIVNAKKKPKTLKTFEIIKTCALIKGVKK